MHPARGRTDRCGHVLQKGNDVMVCSLLDFRDLAAGKARALPDFNRVRLWNLTRLCHCLASEGLDLEPDLELAVFRPELAHLRPGIAVNHPPKIRAGRGSESVLYTTKRRRHSAGRRLAKISYSAAD